MPSYLHPQWQARNALRAYPLRETAPRLSSRGFALPDDLIVDLFLVLAAADVGSFYLQSVCLTPRLVSVVLGDAASGDALAVAAAPVRTEAGETSAFQSAELIPLSSGPGAGGALTGRMTFGPALEAARYEVLLSQMGVGTHFFDAGNTFETRCALLTGPFPVQSLNGQSSDVELRLRGALRATPSELVRGDDGGNIQVLTLSLEDAQAFLSPCDAPGQTPCGDRAPIRSINGVRGDPADGRVTVNFHGFTSWRDVEHSIRILQLQSGRDLCPARPSPDEQGRLPVNYEDDLDPETSY
jgi:hypothetical protein